MNDAAATLRPAPAKPSQARQLFGGAAGNLVEWYDWYAYSAFALYFAPAFFPKGDALAQALNTAAIFAVGFLMRPIGGWVLGIYADKHGRKAALTVSVAMMCTGSLIIAVAPTYDQVGLLAPFILLFARLVQGISVGGEYGTSATFMSEVADPKRRGFLASFQYVTLIGGQLIALGLLIAMQAVLTEDQLFAWGWRVPFAVGALCAVLVFVLRRSLVETDAFKAVRAEDHRGLTGRLLAHPRALLTVLALTAGGSLAFYTYTTYMQKYLVLSGGWSKPEATRITALALVFYMLMQPLFGALSDRIGRRPLLIGFGLLGMVMTVPAMHAIGAATSHGEAFALIMVTLTVLSCYTAISGVVKAEMFPASIRALGVGLPYGVGVAVFGGSAEYVALAFKSAGIEAGFFWYVAVMCGVALVAAWSLPDTRRNSMIETV
ncbi:MFS transporter [Polymorphobacter fuscus]|uniref:MFS transporter n=1 Tax=Sandarakinorhabdus fusca TaxID=1439888 RepID=A0A7C9GT98_9SPHN|nr:MFS transporter [Polymorphobacter fuscus]KAB7648766.1 MFS transporter [Polymorphobacter fuscus]MQT16338.1 MFS transporter [Polymorphobacter fuscus]NJC07374.1 MHS family alpha-ketoglutarate permease-like MFS transporter [Polymorphobacter fuscus]